MEQQKFSIKKRIKSFSYSFNGLRTLLKDEHNSRIHIIALIFVIIAGLILNISSMEWITVIIVSGFVFSMEIINSVVERIADFISPEKNEKIKIIKDLSAAAVLISALTAVITGVIIFIPKLIDYFDLILY